MTAHLPTPSLPGLARRPRLRVASAVAVIPLVGLLAACGGSTGTASTSSTTPPTQAPTSAAGGSGTRGGTGAFPGASGLIAAASPGTLQVQSATAQNTVVYTSSTTFTQVRAGHVAAGDCITLTGTPTSGSAPALTATTARIEAKVNGACPTSGARGGFGAGGFPGGGGGSGQRPSGGPSIPPSAGSGARRAFASASGTVSSVAGSTILVNGTLRNGGQAPSATPASPASPTTITVTLPASATVTQTFKATSAAAVVGQCARAIGTADSTGTISAKSITISTPGANGCNTGFGGRGNAANGTGSPGANA